MQFVPGKVCQILSIKFLVSFTYRNRCMYYTIHRLSIPKVNGNHFELMQSLSVCCIELSDVVPKHTNAYN